MVAVLSVAVRQGLFLLEDRMVGNSEYCGAMNQSLWIQGLANEVMILGGCRPSDWLAECRAEKIWKESVQIGKCREKRRHWKS